MCMPVGLNLFGVLFEAGGEAAMAGRVAHKVKVVGFGRGDRSLERGDSGVGDGAGGQASVSVGVVGRRRLQIGGIDCAPPMAIEQGGVDDRWVGGERHTLRETVDEDTSNKGAFGFLADFLFDERSHGNGPGNVLSQAELNSGLPEAVNHRRKHLDRCGVAGEPIGIGEEKALEGVRRRSSGLGPFGDQFGVLSCGGKEGIAGAEAGGLDCLGDIEDVVALWDG